MLITPASFRRWAARFTEMARRSADERTAEELIEISTRLRALAKRSADNRLKRNYWLERTRLIAPARQRQTRQGRRLGDVAQYSLYFLDQSGAVLASDGFAAPDDATAFRVAAAIGQSSRDAHSGYVLRRGRRHLYGSGDSRLVLADNAANPKSLVPEAQEIILSLEERLLDSHSRIAASRNLLHAMTTLISHRPRGSG